MTLLTGSRHPCGLRSINKRGTSFAIEPFAKAGWEPRIWAGRQKQLRKSYKISILPDYRCHISNDASLSLMIG
jgi:hypothetical protein